jgi:nitroimidazol reductase NimA-like FMN-containing flavoprotein (pyridoxamine 5'-phosphate oxidase superfamily)
MGALADEAARPLLQDSPDGANGEESMLGELTAEEIDAVLRSEAIGRIGCYAYGRPYVVPITYAYDGIAVYGHSREGLKMRMMRSHPTVCFEVDHLESPQDWQSVIALGTFSELEPPEADIAMQLLRRRFAPLVASATSAPDGHLHPSGRPWSVFRILLGERTGRYERSGS